MDTCVVSKKTWLFIERRQKKHFAVSRFISITPTKLLGKTPLAATFA